MPFHNYRGERSARPAKTGGFSQATMRHNVNTFDQYGRKFWFPAENATGAPCGLIQPLFSAPFEVDSQYILVNPDNTSECYCDFRQMVRDRVRAMRAYHSRAIAVAAKKGWEPPALGEYSDDIIAAHPDGVPPRAFQLPLAAEQGNPWVLGESTTPDPRLEPYLETPSREDTEMMEFMDFGAESYDASIGGRAAPSRPRAPFGARRSVAKVQTAGAEENFLESLKAELDEEDAATGTATEDFNELGEADGGVEELEGFESLPSEDEGAEASGVDEGFEDTDPLVDEDEIDPDALGGRTIKPTNADRAAKQAPRRPTQTARRRGARSAPAEEQSPAPVRSGRKGWVAGRPSLADGAKPVIGS